MQWQELLCVSLTCAFGQSWDWILFLIDFEMSNKPTLLGFCNMCCYLAAVQACSWSVSQVINLLSHILFFFA